MGGISQIAASGGSTRVAPHGLYTTGTAFDSLDLSKHMEKPRLPYPVAALRQTDDRVPEVVVAEAAPGAAFAVANLGRSPSLKPHP